MARTRRAAGAGGGPAKPQTIDAWSFSRWDTYQGCPRKARYKFIDKLDDPGGPAMQRGSRIHEEAEHFLKGKLQELPEDLAIFAEEFAELRQAEDLRVEQEWAFSDEWEPTSWFGEPGRPKPWVRIKVDAVCLRDDFSVVEVIDFKTGKRKQSHERQMELYALGAMRAYDDLAGVKVALWYTDSGDIVEDDYSPDQEERLRQVWSRRTRPMLTDTDFETKPSRACSWCPFSKKKGGPCEEGA